jgi:hypothetical protein
VIVPLEHNAKIEEILQVSSRLEGEACHGMKGQCGMAYSGDAR